MKDYDVIKFDASKNVYIVFSTTYVSPIKYINEIENKLSLTISGKASVYFDFLLSSLNSNERYGKIDFNSDIFDRTSFSYVKVDKKDPIRKFSAQYYEKNIDKLDSSSVTSVKKKLISRGIAI